MATKKLTLEIFDPVGNVVEKHELNYVAGHGNRLLLNINENYFIMDKDGHLLST